MLTLTIFYYSFTFWMIICFGYFSQCSRNVTIWIYIRARPPMKIKLYANGPFIPLGGPKRFGANNKSWSVCKKPFGIPKYLNSSTRTYSYYKIFNLFPCHIILNYQFRLCSTYWIYSDIHLVIFSTFK